ncbi:IS1380 family transposase [Cellulomonas fimi]|uniref:IS1380 family transposase n=1 Tax=Cellulomonas fimi TaxID=1708 RepID=A0A7Y0QJT1_CELFI|nr:IS1380 family transposase [Cellulomonas fimi]NMR21677.1 IS1380 family transposase [Cellulomonas fimi]
MMKRSGFYPRLVVDADGGSAVGQAGGVLLTGAVRASGLDVALSAALAPWRARFATHDPAEVLLDLAVTLALGGDACSDLASVRAEPAVSAQVASDPTASRTLARLAGDADKVLTAIDGARAVARARVWDAAGANAPDHDRDARRPLVIDLDATLVTAHSEKENAAPTFKRGFGFHPLCAFVDHGPEGTGEPLSIHLRPGNAGSNTAADHLQVITSALAQIPGPTRGKSVLVRIDGAGGSHQVIEALTRRRLAYSVGFTLPEHTPDLLKRIPEPVWAPALDAHDEVRDGAWVAELTDLMDLSSWPAGMRVIVRKERPHPGAQLRFEDVDGMRITAFVTNSRTGQLADLELRHRRRARCEDRIRIAKDTGLTNLPLKTFDANRIWCAIVALAAEITAWMGMLALHDHDARRWEPKALRFRLFTIPATLARSGRRVRLHLAARSPWAPLALDGLTRLENLAPG